MAKVILGKEWQTMEPSGARFGRGAESFSQRSLGSSPTLSQPLYYSQDRTQLSPFLSNTQLSQPMALSQDQSRSAIPSPIPHPPKQFQPGNGLLLSKLGRYMEPSKALLHPKSNGQLQEAEPAIFLQLINLITDVKTNMINFSTTTISAIETIRHALTETQQQLYGAVETMRGITNCQSSQERDSQLVEKMSELVTRQNAADELTQSVRETLQESIDGLRRCIENEISQRIEQFSQTLAESSRKSAMDRNLASGEKVTDTSEPEGPSGRKNTNRQANRKQTKSIRRPRKQVAKKVANSVNEPVRRRGRPRKHPNSEVAFVSDGIECSVLDWFDDCSNTGVMLNTK